MKNEYEKRFNEGLAITSFAITNDIQMILAIIQGLH